MMLSQASLPHVIQDICNHSAKLVEALIKKAKQMLHVQRKTLTTLAAMCAQLIAAMGTRLEDDKQLVQQDGQTPNSLLAIRYRMEMKLLIQAALALALNKLKTLRD